MGIKVTRNINITSVESRFELTFKRERIDVAKLLKYLKQGHSIDSAFEFNKSIATSIRKMLLEENLIDTKDTVTPSGEEFIKYPYKAEVERGIYNLYLASTEFGLEKIKFVYKMERRLTNLERQQISFDVNETYVGNEFSLGDKEIGVIEKIENKSKSFCDKMPDETITFDITSGTYECSFGEFKMGEAILNIVKKYVSKTLEENAQYFRYNSKNNAILVQNLNDFVEEDLEKGIVSKVSVKDIDFVGVPFEIDDVDIAKQYAYFYLYTKLEKGNYYTIDEMNEVFLNEVLSKNIIADSIKDKLLDFSFSLDGFEKNLSSDKYNKLAYRLKVMKSLLNIDAIKNVSGFSDVKNYDQLLTTLKTKIAPSDVEKLYMVMGYAFARNRKNNMVLCAQKFINQYPDITIVNKSGEGKVNEDQLIKKQINELGVHIINRTEVDTLFHDRYLIFELKDKTYKTFLVTCEIGSLFNIETSETKGTLFEIPNSDVVKNNKSLINMIKEEK